MIPELGHLAMILALSLAITQAIVPLIGSFNGNRGWIALARPAAYGQFVLLGVALVCLTAAFLLDDFSVAYVAHNGNSLLPVIYKVSAVWGAHEGSLLLWAWMLAAWGAAVAAFSRALPQEMVARVLAVMGMVTIGFLLFMLLTSNPFDRLFPAPLEGRDLNPLLQDPGLAIHPPMLYMGYVGFSVAFAFAIAALIGGSLDATWARWSRPWTVMAWAFLTLGIVLGSWWAYYELGWGGWWFWDPVENASFMPWLVGTALIHSLAVTEKRGAFKTWTVLLALSAFSLSLLGTFLVRSGVLTSVHAFATDPARGSFILGFLVIVIGGSLLLYAWRAPRIADGGHFELFSRETLLLVNNLLLTLFAAMVLLGTLAPLIYEAFNLGKISVGFPWFNKMFVGVGPFLAFALGVGMLLRWKTDRVGRLLRQTWLALGLSLTVGFVALLLAPESNPLGVPLGMALTAWVVLTHLISLRHRYQHKSLGLSGVLRDLFGPGRAYFGMWLAHIGVAVFIVGVTMVSHYGLEKDVRMAPGQTYQVEDYTFRFEGVTHHDGPNYSAERGLVILSRGDRLLARLQPEKRLYLASGQPMTEAAIDAGFTRDVYVSLGEPLGDGEWSLRLYYKPYVRWIWLGGLLMALGGVMAIADRRYRIRIRSGQASAAGAEAAS